MTDQATDQAEQPKQKRKGGRKKGTPNKLTKEVRALAREYGPAAVATLYELMIDEEQPGAVRRASAVDLLDRGFGKPSSLLQLGDPDDENGGALPAFIGLVGMTAEDVRAERERRQLGHQDDTDDSDDDDE